MEKLPDLYYNTKEKGGFMMKKFVSYEKLNKKQKREVDLLKREVWDVKPVTKVKESKKVYKRKKTRFDDDSSLFYLGIYFVDLI